MLSNNDLKKRIKNGNILIYPFTEKNIENANICVTASKYTWSIGKNKKGKHVYLFDGGKNQICIPAKQCALIFTNEVVFVGEKLAGECIPRVDLSSRGLSYNGGPMKPGRAEILKVPIYNQTEDDMYINVNDRIAVLMFHELSSKDKKIIKTKGDNNDEIDKFLFECEAQEIVTEIKNYQKKLEDKTSIAEELRKDINYSKFKKSNETIVDKIKRNKALTIAILFLLILIGVMVIVGDNPQYLTLPTTLISIDTAVFVGLLLKKYRLE